MFSFPQVSHQIPACIFPRPHTCYVPRPSHSFDLITRMVFVDEYRSKRLLFTQSSPSPFPSYLLATNIFLCALFSNTLSSYLPELRSMPTPIPCLSSPHNLGLDSAIFAESLFFFCLSGFPCDVLHNEHWTDRQTYSLLSLNRVI